MHQLEGKAFLLTGRFPGTTHAKLRARIEAAGGRVVEPGELLHIFSYPEFAVVGINPSEDRLEQVEGFAEEISLAQLERMLAPHVDADHEAVADGLLSLGIEDGDETVLDLATGAQYDRLLPALTELPPFSSDELTIERLEQSMAVAQLPCTRLSDTELEVTIYEDSATLRLDPVRRWLRLQKAFTINAFVSDGVKHGVVNALNGEWDVVRFFIPAPDTLVADWVIPYHQGIAPFQVVLALQGFVATVQEAMRTCEDVGLLA